jgi:serine/threonine protein kinase
VEDVACGLQYLHNKGVAHRDLKPTNVLVSNQHYCHLSSPKAIEEISSGKPLICKLSDFGESRSQELHMHTILTSKTGRVNRGTPIFMAPELLVKGIRLNEASLEDLKKADIWAYGMIVFSVINPGLKHPFELCMLEERISQGPLEALEKLMKFKTRPKSQEKYATKQAGEWSGLNKVYETCASFHAASRPDMDGIVTMLMTEKDEANNVPTHYEMHLAVSQSSFLEDRDKEIAAQMQAGFSNPFDFHDEAMVIDVDATNACSFLCIKIGDEILSNANVSSWSEVAKIAETVITSFPQVINNFRDVGLRYDVLEAYTVLKSNNCLSSSYQFSEELPYSFGVLTDNGKAKLLESVKAMKNGGDCIGLYMCEPYTFLLGKLMDRIVILDTHPVPSACGGNLTGFLKMFSCSDVEKCAQSACEWLWKRLVNSGMSEEHAQSLSFMRKDLRYVCHTNYINYINYINMYLYIISISSVINCSVNTWDEERDMETPENQCPEDTDNCSQTQSQQDQSPALEKVYLLWYAYHTNVVKHEQQRAKSISKQRNCNIFQKCSERICMGMECEDTSIII